MALLHKIISGGQSGADRAALDFAIEHGFPHGGWCPAGREAEDGPIDARYTLKETASKGYVQRTEWNVRDSDGTVVFSIQAKLTGGSKKTVTLAQKHGKPVLLISRDGQDHPEQALMRFIREHRIRVLNVAGPQASKEPQVGAFVKLILGNALNPAAKQPGKPVKIVLGNREALINMLVETVVRRTHKDINFQFETGSRVGEFIQLATRPQTRLAIFIPPGNLQLDPGTSCATPEQEAIRIIKLVVNGVSSCTRPLSKCATVSPPIWRKRESSCCSANSPPTLVCERCSFLIVKNPDL